MTHEEWQQLLAACAADLAVALPAAGEVARGARVVADELPEPGDAAPFAEVLLHGNELGSVHLLNWRAGAPTLPHAWERGRVIHCLVEGALYETTWRWSGDDLIAVGERRLHAPDVFLAEPGLVRSLVAPEGGTCLAIRTSPRDTVRVYDREAGAVRVAEGDGHAVAGDADAAHAREPWGRPD